MTVWLRLLIGYAGLAGLGVLALPGLFALVVRFRRARPRPMAPPGDRRPRLVFLVPAHNEQLLVRPCVRSLLGQDYPASRRRVVVIADNCSDETAAIARAEGAEVLERTDLELKGKPRALAWAIDQLGLEGADAFIVIDADSEVASDYANCVAAVGDLRESAIQTYFGISNEYETWLTRLAGLLMRLRYESQFPAKRRAGLNVPLTGNGMVLGAELLRRRPWSAFSVTEDWELYAEYTAHGVRVDYVREARLISQETRSTDQSTSQRQRWQAGRREVWRKWGRAIWTSTGISRLQKLDAHLELNMPSPAVHLALVATCWGVAVIGGVPTRLHLLGAALAGGELTVGVISTILRHPEPLATVQALARAPGYVLWRLAVGLSARTSRRARSEWVRTARHQHR